MSGEDPKGRRDAAGDAHPGEHAHRDRKGSVHPGEGPPDGRGGTLHPGERARREKLVYPGPTIFTHELAVRITDLNYGNHLGHDALVSLLHEARARWFRTHDMVEAGDGKVGILLVDLAVSYRAQAFFGQTLRIELAAHPNGARGCVFHYRVTERDAGTLVAVARTGLVFFDYTAQRPARMPERFREAIGAGE